MAGEPAQLLTQQKPFGFLDLAGEEVGAHLVRLVDDYQVPLGSAQIRNQILVAGELVHARDQVGALGKCRATERALRARGLEDLKAEAELEVELVLPLLDQTAWGDDQTAMDIIAEDQLLDVEAGHDRLAGAGVVCEQEPQRGTWQQIAVNRPDLVRQRLDVARRHGEHRVEETGELDPLGLGSELELRRVGIEGPAGAIGQAVPVLLGATENPRIDRPVLPPVDQLGRIGSMAGDRNELHHLTRNQAAKALPCLQRFEDCRRSPIPTPLVTIRLHRRGYSRIPGPRRPAVWKLLRAFPSHAGGGT